MNIEETIKNLTLEEKAGLCSGFDFWHTKAVERLNIPSVMMTDGPNGLRKQKDQAGSINVSIEAVCFPTASALAASFDRDLMREIGEELGDECVAENVSMLLGPGVNIKRSPLCGRNFEYFSEDPYLAGETAAAYINGLQSKGIAACVKHYAANNQEYRRFSGSSEVDERTLREIYLPAFETAVKKGKTRSIMCSYNKINGTYSAENKWLLTDVLRGEWGFGGFVVTDWGAVKDRVKGIESGLDLEMPGPGTQDALVVKAVRGGVLDEKLLDDCVRNMLTYIDNYSRVKTGGGINVPKGRKLALKAAERCAVLLKNENGILPLKKSAKVAFLGDFAANPRYQGSGSSHINVPELSNALDEAKKAGLNVVTSAADADAAVVFVGLTDAYETEGVDRKDMTMPREHAELIEKTVKANPNTVVVLHTGSPVEMPWVDTVPAILNMYLAGDGAGAAAVKLLFGDANPSGKLAETFPVKLSDNPSYLHFPGEHAKVEYKEGVFVGYRYYDKKEMQVLFPFGHGLSYTTFAYSGLKIGKAKITDGETVTVKCTVKNAGKLAGREVVQLYVKNAPASVNRPVRELKGYAVAELAPGEAKEVEFTLCKRAFAYWEPRIHDWYAESGVYGIDIGSSSRDITLSGEVEVESSVETPVVFSRESTLSDLEHTAKGRVMLEEFQKQFLSAMGGDDAIENLGEGGKEMARAMMLDLPLGSLGSLGQKTPEEIDAIIAELNA